MKGLITAGDLQRLDNRFNDILKVGAKYRIERLKNMMFDIDLAFDIKRDAQAQEWYRRVGMSLHHALGSVRG